MTLTAQETASAVIPDADAVRLSVRGLDVGFTGRDGRTRSIVRDVSFDLRAGRCVAIVGESGSGKSVTARTLVGLTGEGAVVDAAELTLGDVDLASATRAEWRGIRGRRIGFIQQDALVSLDPLRRVGSEIAEALRLHRRGRRAHRRRRVLDLLTSVEVPLPERRARQRPGELSGGLRQRALIASAIALDPEVVIADEPTTALDVTVQAQVLALLEDMKAHGSAILLISHDLSVVAHLADEILVMRAGDVLEHGTTSEVLRAPRHPYTRALISAVPGAHTRGRRLAPQQEPAPDPHRVRPDTAGDGPVVQARGLVKRFRGGLLAVDDVSFDVHRGETLGIVGESGSGKSTTARLVLALEKADAGEVRLLGHAWSTASERARRSLRRRVGVVHQDPLSSFDPRWSTERILQDAIGADAGGRSARDRRVRDLLAQVALPESVRTRHPLTLSGGQRQRIAIARALATSPEIIVLDEAVSALDVSVQAQILDLLGDLQREYGLSYLFISHDLGVIHHMSDRVLVMKDGVVVEQGDADRIFLHPAHPYTRELIGSLTTLENPDDNGGAS
ncbi:ABC transporter ATP-binding protein [Microbacterium soli]|uniref:ABC transporter ATP-binding protein n=1 Tax=Microbacterium soli TaxID=446075 RepID=A0ABP7N8V5_9MICO